MIENGGFRYALPTLHKSPNISITKFFEKIPMIQQQYMRISLTHQAAYWKKQLESPENPQILKILIQTKKAQLMTEYSIYFILHLSSLVKD